MAKLPAGWVFIPVMKNMTEIEIKQMGLVTCKDCKWCDPKDRKCKHADMGSPFPRAADFFCAWGEEYDSPDCRDCKPERGECQLCRQR